MSEDDEVLVKAGVVRVNEGVQVLATDNTIDLISTISDSIVAIE